MKMKKLLKVAVVLALLLCSVVVLFACGEEETPDKNDNASNAPKVTITFVDGDEVLKETNTVKDALEFKPEKEGYELEGWYFDEELTERLETIPTKSVTLYAKWKVKSYVVRFINYDGQAIKVNGEDFQMVEHGGSAVAPKTEPERDGYVFQGWDKDFSVITADTQVKPKFEKRAYSIILYGQDGKTIVKQQDVQVGKDVSELLDAFILEAEASVSGGFQYAGLYANKELTQMFTKLERMPERNVEMYVKVALQGIQGLSVTSDRDGDAFRYDKKGFTLTGDFTKNTIEGLVYTYEWRCNGDVIEGANGTVLEVGVLPPSEYIYTLTITATYGNLEPQYASCDISMNISAGLLGELPEAEQIKVIWPSSVVYSGQVVEPTFENLLEGDKVTYKLHTSTNYSATSPVRNYDRSGYSVDVKVEREYYEPIEFKEARVMVTKAKLTASMKLGEVSNQDENSFYSVEYGSELPEPTYEISGFKGYDTALSVLKWSADTTVGNVIYVTDYAQYSPVLEEGYYSIAISPNTWNSLSNYEFDDENSWKPVKINVVKKKLIINVQNSAITYGDPKPQDDTFSAVLGNGSQGLPLDRDSEAIASIISASYVCSYEQYNDVGEYDIALDFENANLVEEQKAIINSYEVTVKSGVLEVAKKAVTLTPENVELTYGDKVPTYTFKAEGLINDANVQHGIEVLGNVGAYCMYAEKSNVGTYPISVLTNTITSKNYAVTCNRGSLKVLPKEVTLTLTESIAITYRNSYPSREEFDTLLIADGLIVGDTIATLRTNDYAFTSSYAIGQPVGEYPIMISGYSNANYSITYVTEDAPLIVNKRPLTISVEDAEIVYGDAYNYKLNYSDLSPKEKEDVSSVFSKIGTITVDNMNAGMHTVSVSGYEAYNYNITYQNGKLNVLKRELTIKARSYVEEEDYWTSNLALSEKVTVMGLASNDVIANGIISTNSNLSGAYTVNTEAGQDFATKFNLVEEIMIKSGEADTTANYVIYFDLQVAIKTYGLMVTAEKAVYDGTSYGVIVEQMFEEKMADILYSTDNETFVETPIEFTEAGTHTLYYMYRVYGANGEVEKEVKADEPAIISIMKRTIYIVADDKNITYGDNEPEYTYLVKAYEEGKDVFVGNDTMDSVLAFTVDASAYNNNAGEYAIEYVGEILNANYEVKHSNATLNVARKDLTVTLGDNTIFFGDPIPNFDEYVVVEGFVLGESVESLGTQILYNHDFVAGPSGVADKDYVVQPVLELDNYDITINNGNLRVNKRAITLTATNLNAFYNDEKPELKLTSSDLGVYNGINLQTLGTYDISVSYEKGNDAGSYAIVLSNFVSDKYTATLKNGTLTVKPYETQAIWVGNNGTYVYNGEDQSASITATYKDVNNNVIDAIISFSASNSTPNIFKNAGDYTITATSGNKNYKLTGASLGKKMDKATYTGSYSHEGLSGVYSPEKTFAHDDYALSEYYYWTVPTDRPVVNKTEYSAYYNADKENYYNVPITITVTIAPASVNLVVGVENGVSDAYTFESSSTEITSSYNVSAPSVYWNDGAKVIEEGFSISYEGTLNFTPGTHMKEITFSSPNYKLNTTDVTEQDGNFVSTFKYFVKVRNVEYSGGYWTIEEVLAKASSGQVNVRVNTSFATSAEARDWFYGDDMNGYYTIKSGVTILLPYSDADTVGNISGGEKGSTNYTNHPDVACNVENSERRVYVTMDIPACVTLNVSGNFIVGALTGGKVTAAYQNGVNGGYAVVNLNGKIVATNAILKVYGYILGNGTIEANGTTEVTENMYITGWLGGTQSAAKHLGNQSLANDILTFGFGGTYTDKDPFAYPYNEYEMRAIQSKLVIDYGASLKGYIKIATGDVSVSVYTIKAKISDTIFEIVTNESGGGILRMSSGARITKSFANDRVKIEMEGTVSDNYAKLSVPVLKATVNMSSQLVFFPIDGRTDIVIKNGATFNQNYKFKLLPGATLTVEQGGTYNINAGGQTVIYDGSFYDSGVSKPYTQGRGDAQLIVNGTLIVNGALGGNVTSTANGVVNVGSGATLTVTSPEVASAGRDGLSFVITEGHSQTKSLQLNSVDAVAGTNYRYNGASWDVV